MSNLARIFQRHDGKALNAKLFQHAGRFASRTSAYNLIADGSESYEKFRDMLRRLPRPVTHDILNDLTEELAFAIVARDASASDVPPVKLSIGLTARCAALSERMLAALADNRIDDIEDAELEPAIADVERMLAQLRTEKNKRRVPRRTA